MSTLKMMLLGDPLILYDEKPLRVDTKKAIALLARLALRPEPVRRDYLTALLWSDSDESHARSALRRTLSVVHNELNKERLIVTTNTVALKDDEYLWVDVRLFNTLLEQVNAHHTSSETLCPTCVSRLKNVIELYRGDFLTGFTLRDSLEFDEWQQFESEKFRQDFINSLRRLVEWHLDHAHYEDGIRFALRWSQLDNFSDQSIYFLMQLYAYSGQRNLALQCYKNFETLLDEELGISPVDETLQLYEQILNDELRPRLVVAEKAASPPRHNLSVQTKSFIGRQKEIAYLQSLILQETAHLITLVAPGGMGKTRLALETAYLHLDYFPQGTFFVSLNGEVTQLELLAEIARVLEHQFYPSVPPRKQILDLLSQKTILLVLDNFECYQDDLGLLTDIIQQAPYVKILVVSQQPLNLEEEWLCQLKGLPVPDEMTEDLLENDAVGLFIQCARKLYWDYQAEAQLPDIIELCRYVEGMPLALELIAANEGIQSCKTLLAEFKANLNILQTPYTNVAPRHRNLYSIFEYSWSHLSAPLQTLLLNLTVFQGSFTYAQTLAIIGTTKDGLDMLQRRALLNEVDVGRYNIPNVLRRFLAEKQPTEKHAYGLAHSRYFAELVRQVDFERLGDKNELQPIAIDIANIRAGWQYALKYHEFDLIDAYLHNLYMFYNIQGRYEESKICFEEALALLEPLDYSVANIYARIQTRIGFSYADLGQMKQAVTILETSLGIQEQQEDWAEVAWILNLLGIVNLTRDDYPQAEAYFKDSLSIAESIPNQGLIAKARANLGILAKNRAQYDEAYQLLMQAHNIYLALGYQRLISSSLNNLGNLQLDTGNFEEAETLYHQSYDMKKQQGDQWGETCALLNWGRVALEREALDNAYGVFKECLHVAENLGRKSAIARSHYYLGKTTRQRQDWTDALDYFRQALTLEYHLGNWLRTFMVLDEIAELYKKQGNTTSAFQIWNTLINDKRISEELRLKVEAKLGEDKSSRVSTENLVDKLIQSFLEDESSIRAKNSP